jgi:hypothetical protein
MACKGSGSIGSPRTPADRPGSGEWCGHAGCALRAIDSTARPPLAGLRPVLPSAAISA